MATSNTPASTAETVQRAGLDMVHLVEQLFDAFSECVLEYHKTASGEVDAVRIERPVPIKAGDPRYGGYGEAAFFGRLALREWSLVVRGQPERIDGAIITSDQLLLYNANPNSFGRFFAIELKSTSDPATWMIGRRPFTSDQLPLLAKQLHAALARAAKRGKPTSTFRFSTGKTSAMDAISLPVDAQAPGAQRQSSTLPQRPRSYYEDTDTVFAALNPGMHASESMPSVPPSQQVAQQSSPDTFGQRSAALQAISVSEALHIALEGLTAELGAIQQAVTQAIEFGDSTGAEELIRRKAKVKHMQEMAHALCQEWLHIKPGG